jgi:CubicO group peptidase (beta-lactamase class C family)
MPKLLRHLLLFPLALVSLLEPSLAQNLSPAVPESVGVSSERLTRLDDAMKGYVDDNQLSGAVVLIARRGGIVYHKAFGERDQENASPMTKDAIFRIASQTKALVSVGVMVLQEQGKLLIGDPVSKYVPEFAHTTVAIAGSGDDYTVVDANRPIVLRDLLTHTSGVSYGNGPAADQWEEAGIQGWYFADREEPVGETIAQLPALPFDAQPGEAWVYGYNTDILGAVIEKASGQPLDMFLTHAVLAPLGMHDTHFYLPPDKSNRLAVVYSSSDGGGFSKAPDPGHMVGQGAYLNGPRVSFSGGAGLLSTANDYARFLQMMLNGGTLDGHRILSRKTVELMTVDHLSGLPFRPGTGFGLGFSVVTDLGARGIPGSLGEYGWGGAYHSTYWVDPQEELVVVYLTQLIPAQGVDDHAKLRSLLYQAIED